MTLIIVVISSLMLIGAIYQHTRTIDFEATKLSSIAINSIDQSERQEKKFSEGVAQLDNLALRVAALEARPSPVPTGLLPSKITIEIIDQVKQKQISVPKPDNADSIKALDTLRAVRSRQKKPVYSRTTQ